MTQRQRFRVLSGDVVPQSPLALARHVVSRCAEGPVTFRAMLETERRSVVEALGPQVHAETADVGTVSLLTDPRDVPLDDAATDVPIQFLEQRAVPGLTQLWVSEFRDQGARTLSLHMRISRRDPLAIPTLVSRLVTCADAGILPRNAPFEAPLRRVLDAVAATESSAREELGAAVLRAQSFFEGSSEALVSLDVPPEHRARLITAAGIWAPTAPLELRRYGTPEAALRAPNVQSFAIHSRLDGPLTDALLAARSAAERFSVEWEFDDRSDLRSVSLATDEAALEVDLVVPGTVDFDYGPDPLDLVEWIGREAGVELEYLGGA